MPRQRRDCPAHRDLNESRSHAPYLQARLPAPTAVVRLIEFERNPKDVAGRLGKTQPWESLRRKIADHRGHLGYFVSEDRTRDAETLAMLVDLEKIDRQAFSEMHQVERITRAAVREALDRAKLRKLAPLVPIKAPEVPALVPTEPPAQPQPRDDAPTAPREGPESPPVRATQPVPAEELAHPRAAKPKAVPSHPEQSENQGQADRYEEARRAVQAAIGLPVSIHTPHAGKPGELRISFADLLELDALRQNLT